MRTFIAFVVAIGAALPAHAYEIKNLTAQDVIVIGRGLDKLPREDTDANGLYSRIQQQLSAQDAAAKKAASAPAPEGK